MLARRIALALPLLGACSVLPDRPAIESRRFPLAPARPAPPRTARARRSLLVRLIRWAPGLDARGLRTLRADGTENTDFYNEWSAPPADLAEEALRRWLGASGLFTAILSPGTRAQPDLVLEAELTQLRAEPARRLARAGLALILSSDAGETARILAQFTAEAEAPLAGAGPAEAAAAMTAALAETLALTETRLAGFA